MTRVLLEPRISFSNEVLSLAEGYRRTDETWYLYELKAVLKEIDEDLNERTPYRLLRAFIAEGCHRVAAVNVEDNSDTKTTLGRIAQEVNQSAQRMMPMASESAPSITAEKEAVMLVTIRKKLVETRDAGAKMDEKLKKMCGDVANDALPNDIWGHFADACDTDSARLAFFGVARHFVIALLHRNRGLDAMAGDIIEMLDKLNLAEKYDG